jgi:hypothetical protein
MAATTLPIDQMTVGERFMAMESLWDSLCQDEAQQAGLGTYFLESIYSDIESLRLYAGIHRVVTVVRTMWSESNILGQLCN